MPFQDSISASPASMSTGTICSSTTPKTSPSSPSTVRGTARVSSFEDLDLSPEVRRALYVIMGYKRPGKVQEITLPMILTPPYKDLVAQAHNGTGKTSYFGLRMLGQIDPKVKAPQALCICPTRELTIQILEVVQRMATYMGIKIVCCPKFDAKSCIYA